MHVMLEQPLSGRPATARLGTLVWSCVSLALHALVFTRSCAVQRSAEVERPSPLPMQVELGLADPAPGGGDQTREPPPAPAPTPQVPSRRVRVKAASEAIVVAPKQAERAAKAAAPAQAAATSGEGTAADGAGAGLGAGSGAGSGGAGFALNVDLQRIRKTALILETEALLNVVPDRRLNELLAESRNRQVVSSGELQRPGSAAIAEGEALTLWIEGVHEYLRFDSPAVPQSVRLALVPIDQFRNELRIHADYPSSEHASEAARALQELRVQLSEHPKVIFQGLKSAVDEAQLEQRGAALLLRAQLTLHQTRHLMRHIRRALEPKN